MNQNVIRTTILDHLIISIVSHRQIDLIYKLLSDFEKIDLENIHIILTINVPEDLSALRRFESLRISVINNENPKGFGENHNAAFESTNCEYFVVVNPDIRLRNFDKNSLLAPFDTPDVGAVAPVVLSSTGHIEDSVRRFPSVLRLFKRTVLGKRDPDYYWDTKPIDVDWSAGMFVVYRAKAFEAIAGFDSRYFMYMEDADICLRLKRAGWRTVLQPKCSVVHDARRASHKSFQHLRWHLASAFRFLFLPTRKQPPIR